MTCHYCGKLHAKPCIAERVPGLEVRDKNNYELIMGNDAMIRDLCQLLGHAYPPPRRQDGGTSEQREADLSKNEAERLTSALNTEREVNKHLQSRIETMRGLLAEVNYNADRLTFNCWWGYNAKRVRAALDGKVV